MAVRIERAYKPILNYPVWFWDLHEETLNCYINGCGPEGWKEKIVPDAILGVDISQACAIHDVEYGIGQSIDQKDLADKRFLDNMLTLIERGSSNNLMRWIRNNRAMTYYNAVSIAGSSYFGA